MAVKKQQTAGPKPGERYRPESYDELFPGRFLKAGLFKGKEVTLRIADVYQELMPDKKGTILNSEGERCKKQTIFGVETPQGRRLEQEVAINKTNAISCLLMFGKSVPGWVGRLVTFAPRIVDAFGEEKEAIRIVGSPELTSNLEKSARVGQSDKAFKLKKTPMPPNVRVVEPAKAPAAAVPKEEEPEQEPESDPFESEKAAAAAIEEQHDPFEEGPTEEGGLEPLPDGQPL